MRGTPADTGHQLSRGFVEEALALAEPREVTTQQRRPPRPHVWVSMTIFMEDPWWEEKRQEGTENKEGTATVSHMQQGGGGSRMRLVYPSGVSVVPGDL